jgi:hypothetical protein
MAGGAPPLPPGGPLRGLPGGPPRGSSKGQSFGG